MLAIAKRDVRQKQKCGGVLLLGKICYATKDQNLKFLRNYAQRQTKM
jgi:predicted transcriptional regulator of viral defense system